VLLLLLRARGQDFVEEEGRGQPRLAFRDERDEA
jgi:hypothetical protein